MNKTYKTIYKEGVGWVTVSELASSRGKPSSSRRLAKTLSGVVLVTSSLLLTQTQLNADTHYYSVNDNNVSGGNYNNDGATGTNALAAGVNAKAEGNFSVAVGNGAKAEGDSSVAVGDDAKAEGKSSVAVGDGAEAEGKSSVAVGDGAYANYDSAVAVGDNAHAKYYSAVAVGNGAEAKGQSSVAIGTEASATNNDSIAFGSNASSIHAGSVALGKDSIANGSTLGTPAYQPLDGDGNPIAVAAPTATSEVSVGSAGKERRIINVAAGATDTDAVNVSQLKAVHEVASAGWNLTTNGDANSLSNVAPGASVDLSNTDGNIAITQNGNDVTFNLADDVNIVNSLTVANGPRIDANGIDMNGNTISNLADGVNDGDAVNLSQLNAAIAGSTSSSTVEAGTGIDVTSVTDANNTTNYVVALNQDTKDSLALADSALQSFTTQIDGVDVATVDKNTTALNFIKGDNIELTDVNGSIKIATKPDIRVDSLTINNGGPTIDGNGIDMNGKKITNLADGVDDGDAVNVSQLKSVSDVANAGWNLTANGGATTSNVAPNESVDLSSGDGSIVITQNDNNVTFDLADNVNIANSLTIGDSNLTTAGLTVDDGAGNVTTTTATGTTVTDGTYTTALSATGLTTGDIKVDGTTNTIGGLSNTTFDPNNITSGQAATEDQLKSVSDVANAGWNLTANGGANGSSNVAPGSTVDFSSSDDNIVITNDGLNVELALADDVMINNSITVGDTKIDTEGLTIVGGPSVTKEGIDAGGKVIVGVAAGEVSATSTEAINGSQLYAVEQVANAGWNLKVNDSDSDKIAPNDTLKVVDGTNTVVTYDADNKELKVSMVDDPTFTKEVTMEGGMKVAANQTVDMGGNVISNVAAGNADTDAVNVAQLNEVSNKWIVGEQTTDHVAPVAIGKGSTALGSGAVASGDNSVALGADSSDEGRANVVSVGSAGNERQITNVAAGTNPTDAVNVNQLQGLGNYLNDRINTLDKKASAGTAAAMATGGLLQATIPGKGMASMSGGYYDGQSAVALGISKMSDNGKWVVKAGASIDSQDNVGVSAAVGFHF